MYYNELNTIRLLEENNWCIAQQIVLVGALPNFIF